MIQHCNNAGQNLIKKFEGLRLSVYKCPAGFNTIGYGHTLTAKPGMTIDAAEADRLLASDLARVEPAIATLVHVPLNNNQFSALCCFAFNIGITAFSGSSLRRLLNRGWYDQVPVQLKRWVKVRGLPLPGLIARRIAEGALWNTPDDTQTTTSPITQGV